MLVSNLAVLSTSTARIGASIALCTALGVPAMAAPFVPQHDTDVVETLPAGASDRGLRAIRAQLARNPDDPKLALSAAQRYVERARTTGDPRYLGHAQAALGKLWDSDDPQALLLRATVLQSRHEFNAATADLQRLLAQSPNDAQAWLTLATIQQVQGRYADATQSCTRVTELIAGPVGQACRDELRSLTGDAPAAYRTLRARAESMPAGPGAGATQGWTLTLLAEMAERMGLVAEAEQHYRAALAAAPDLYTRAAYADFLLDAKRPRDALAVLGAGDADQAQLLRLSDGLLLRAALALRALDDPRTNAIAGALRERFAAARLRGETSHGREEARFALVFDGDAQRAADLAAANWQNQREPADARIALEAAQAAGRKQLAAEVERFVRTTGLRDERLSRLLARSPA